MGNVFQPVGTDGGQSRILGGHAEELVAGSHQGGVAQAAAVDQLEVDAAGIAQFEDGGGRKGKDQRVAEAGKRPHGPAGDRLDPQVRPVALLPILHLDKDHAVAL